MLWWNALMRADVFAGARRSDTAMGAVKIDRFEGEAMVMVAGSPGASGGPTLLSQQSSRNTLGSVERAPQLTVAHPGLLHLARGHSRAAVDARNTINSLNFVRA